MKAAGAHTQEFEPKLINPRNGGEGWLRKEGDRFELWDHDFEKRFTAFDPGIPAEVAELIAQYFLMGYEGGIEVGEARGRADAQREFRRAIGLEG